MKTYYAYIRVSTTRQGEEEVSLQEQRRAAHREGSTPSPVGQLADGKYEFTAHALTASVGCRF